MADFAQIFELDRLARNEVEKYDKKRALFQILSREQGRHAIGIVGPRGVGKTILLKQLAVACKNSLYLSMDTVEGGDLFEIAQKAHEQFGIKALFLDEIHSQRDYPVVLKKIFDFLEVRVVFTSSVSLALYESSVDLSRRVRLEHLYPFTFGEYIAFKTGNSVPPLTFEDICEKKWETAHFRYASFFDEYLKGGLMPFSLEEPDVLPLLKNIVNTVIAKDIPAVARLLVNELPLIHKLLIFIGKSSLDGINYSSLSRNIGITKYKAEAYVGFLEKAFILNPVFPMGANVLREPKVLMNLPYRLLYADFKTCIGGLREDFFAETLGMKGIAFDYLKSMRGQKTPDYLVKTASGDVVVEIGGKSKGRQQFKGIKAKKEIIFSHDLESDGIRRPLFMLGYL
ncbi:MAG: AAA family ATPase [Chitinivibrionales bacterium]|nr:AAA family ATPase [Chitinivibrionales bacterium]